MKTALLYSGGLDSLCAWYVLGKPDAVYIGGEFGPARDANVGEVAAINAHCGLNESFRRRFYFNEFDFTPFMRDGEYHMPREMICTQLAWAMGYDRILIAFCADDGITPEWAEVQSRNFGLAVGMAGLTVEFPVAAMTKADLVATALKRGATPEIIASSWSCVRQSEIPCGKCQNCKQRKTALSTLVAEGLSVG